MKKGLVILLSLALLIGTLTACSSTSATTITVYTVAGGDEYYKDILVPMFEKKMGGKYKVRYGRGTPQEIINKIKAQGKNGNIDIVITGLDGLTLGIEAGLWDQMIPKYEKEVHANELTEAANAYVEKFKGYGVPISNGPGGPVLAYNKNKVKEPPKTYEELKKWIHEHPKKFMYASVPSSGPGRGFFFGAIQALGEDFNKADSLDKTWGYLQDIGQDIDLYPSKTSETFNFLNDGTVDMIAHTPVWFARQKSDGTLPPNIDAVKLQGAKQVVDAHFFVMLKGLPEERKKAALEFINFAMSKESQAQGLPVGTIPSNKYATPDLIQPQYREQYKKLLDAIMPDFKEGDKIILPEGDWVLFPDTETMNKLYKEWEEKIQSKK